MKKIEILDSTLRDGSQGEGISYSVQDKIRICQALDELGVSYIEAGNPGSNPKDMEFFQELKKIAFSNAQICAFGSTRRKESSCSEDSNLQSLLAAATKTVVIFGKSWPLHVTEILRTSLEENLLMIKESCDYLCQHGRNVIYDAEHFFTAYMENKEYAIKTLDAAVEGGAEVVCLCETKGGMMLDECRTAVRDVVKHFAGKKVKIGIHTHNDCGLAVANSLQAVLEGAVHVQGVMLGFGERTGNANLSTLIPDLQLKLGFECIPPKNMKNLTAICNRLSEITNVQLNSQLPFVGKSAFAHKAGMHIDAVLKNPTAYEHIEPELVGNSRVFLMSEVAGRSTVLEKIQKIFPNLKKNDPVVNEIIARMKELEFEGYQFEGADGSFELMVRKFIGQYKPFFKLHYYQTSGSNPRPEAGVCCCAQIKVEVDGQIEITAGEGDGPVNALDIALRKALVKFYPLVAQLRLVDFKVRVLDGKSATASKVRVIIETTDGEVSWTTVGVSSDLIEASWIALCDSFEYKLIRDIEKRYNPVIIEK
ncbi:MAG: citramalate synthase [Treponema sp.]|nr:citramalate synthase [Treponema sp.]